jgi:hypothetical protein
MRNRREQRSEEQIQSNNMNVRESMAQLCESQSHEARAERSESRRLEKRQARRFVVNARRVIGVNSGWGTRGVIAPLE